MYSGQVSAEAAFLRNKQKRNGGPQRLKKQERAKLNLVQFYARGVRAFNASNAEDGFLVDAELYEETRDPQTNILIPGTRTGVVTGILHVEYDLESGDPRSFSIEGNRYSLMFLKSMKILLGRKVAPSPKVPVLKEEHFN